MGISNDIKPRRHQRPSHRLDFLDEKEPAIPVHAEHHTHRETVEEPKEPAKTHTHHVEHFRVPNPALEDQFFGHSEIHTAEKGPQAQSLNRHEKKGAGTKYLWALVIILIFAAAIYESPYRKQLFENANTPATENNDETGYTGEVVTQDYITGDSTSTETATPTPSPSVTPSTTPTPTPTVSTTPETSKANISLKVLNGNGITGSADTVKKTLTAAGFTISSVTNAKSFSYLKTYVYYHTGKETEANLVNAALSGRETIVQLSDTVTGSSYDVVVVVGKK